MPQEWFVRRGDKVRGPLTSEEVKQLVAKGILVASDMVRKSENPEWRQAGTVKGLFGAVRSEAPVPSPLPQSKAEAPFVSVPPPLPSSPANRQAVSTPHPSTAKAVETMQAGLTDIMSTAKQAKDLAAAHARKTQITQMTLPKAYLTLGNDVFLNGRFRDELSDLFQRITATNDEITKVATTAKERPQATDLKGKLQSGAAQLMAQGQTTKLGYQRESLVRELGKKAFESHGTSAGSLELVSPITSANEEIARLDEQIAGLSSGKQGSIWQRLPIAALLTAFCWPIGMLLVWFNPRLSRRSKWVWTGASIGAFMVLAIVVPKRTEPSASNIGLVTQDGDDANLLRVDASSLVARYRENIVAANDEYKNKLIQVVGKVQNINEGWVELESIKGFNGKNFDLLRVHVYFTDKEMPRMASLRQGQRITVNGTCTGKGFLDAINIEKCVLME